jgi:RNA polymerase subunit RPABC4/transcription elongation factor Spt4
MLIYEYGFIPEKNWKESLVGQVLKIKEDIKITLYNDKLKKSITFWYEKKLLNGKRPDFILDVKSLVTNVSKRFIMDAKFKEGEDISKIIKELYFEKNYSENYNNMVFVIHPDQSYIIENLENPQDWANQAYYGETELYYFENKLPNHRYGAILLSPFNNNVYYLDNLKRLISMFLQYGIEKNNKVEKNNFYKYDPMIEEVPFCTLCSSINLNIQPFENKYHNVGIGYKVTCNDCEHVMEYNYCSSCQNRIIKNGRYWSYQATKPIEQFNIKCPHCGDFRLEGLE